MQDHCLPVFGAIGGLTVVTTLAFARERSTAGILLSLFAGAGGMGCYALLEHGVIG